MVHPIVGFIAGFVLFLGTLVTYIAGKQWMVYRRVARTETESVGSIDAEGRTAVEGRVVPAGEETASAPITGDDAVVTAWRVEEYTRTSDDDASWVPIAKGVEAVSFRVDDGTVGIPVAVPTHQVDAETGEYPLGNGVAPDLATNDGIAIDRVLLEFESFPAVEVDVEEETPQGVASFVAERPIVPEGRNVEDRGIIEDIEEMDAFQEHVETGDIPYPGDRRYYEGVIEPGATVYVQGRVESDESRNRVDPERATIVPPPDDPMVVSTQTAAELRAEFGGSRRALVLGGVMVVGSILTLGSLAVDVYLL